MADKEGVPAVHRMSQTKLRWRIMFSGIRLRIGCSVKSMNASINKSVKNVCMFLNNFIEEFLNKFY